LHPSQLVRSAREFMKEFQKVAQGLRNNVTNDQEIMVLRWKKLLVGMIKINWDAIVDTNKKEDGSGDNS
jgi:hypothetical protein